MASLRMKRSLLLPFLLLLFGLLCQSLPIVRQEDHGIDDTKGQEKDQHVRIRREDDFVPPTILRYRSGNHAGNKKDFAYVDELCNTKFEYFQKLLCLLNCGSKKLVLNFKAGETPICDFCTNRKICNQCNESSHRENKQCEITYRVSQTTKQSVNTIEFIDSIRVPGEFSNLQNNTISVMANSSTQPATTKSLKIQHWKALEPEEMPLYRLGGYRSPNKDDYRNAVTFCKHRSSKFTEWMCRLNCVNETTNIKMCHFCANHKFICSEKSCQSDGECKFYFFNSEGEIDDFKDVDFKNDLRIPYDHYSGVLNDKPYALFIMGTYKGKDSKDFVWVKNLCNKTYSKFKNTLCDLNCGLDRTQERLCTFCDKKDEICKGCETSRNERDCKFSWEKKGATKWETFIPFERTVILPDVNKEWIPRGDLEPRTTTTTAKASSTTTVSTTTTTKRTTSSSTTTPKPTNKPKTVTPKPSSTAKPTEPPTPTPTPETKNTVTVPTRKARPRTRTKTPDDYEDPFEETKPPGERRGASSGSSSDENSEEGGSGLIWVYVVIAVVVVLCGIAVAAVLLKKQRTKKKEAKDLEARAKKELEDMLEAAKPPAPEVLPPPPPAKKKKLLPQQPPAGKVTKKDFKFLGPLTVDSGPKGPIRHALEDEKSHSIKEVVFDPDQNYVRQIGSDVELVEASPPMEGQKSKRTGRSKKSQKSQKSQQKSRKSETQKPKSKDSDGKSKDSGA